MLVVKPFWLEKKFWSEKNIGQKKILVEKNFGRKIFLLGGGGDPNFFLHISSSWVKIRLDAENHLPGMFLLVGLK